MRRFSALGLILLVSLMVLSACGRGSSPLVGRWSATDTETDMKATLEFTADGKLIMSVGRVVLLVGTYRVLNENQIEWVRGELWGTQIKIILDYRIQGDTLIIDDPSDPSTKLVLKRS
jgi:hypothetical protein